MSITPSSQTEELLIQSAEQYRELLQNVENLLKTLDECDYSQINNYALRLQQLQNEAKQQDEHLLPLLIADFATWKDNAFYKMRLDYINSILELNELLEPKIRGVMAVTSVELKKMSGCRTALVGYSSKITQPRGLRGIG